MYVCTNLEYVRTYVRSNAYFGTPVMKLQQRTYYLLIAVYIPSLVCACRKKLVVKPRPRPTPPYQPQAQRKPVGYHLLHSALC